MLLDIIIFLVVITVMSLLMAGAGGRRRFNCVRVPVADGFGHFRRVQLKRIPTDQEITAEAVAAGAAYDSSDDLLDPSNHGHAKWPAEHPATTDEDPPSQWQSPTLQRWRSLAATPVLVATSRP